MDILYTKSEYAKIKNVSAQYIGKIIHKLKVKKIGSITMIKNCDENDKLFLRPAWNHKSKISDVKPLQIDYGFNPGRAIMDAYNNRKKDL